LTAAQLDADSIPAETPSISNAKCDFIYYALQALLLRMHGYVKRQRLGTAGIFRVPGVGDTFQPPLLLRPVIDLLQYEVFCERIKTEIHAMLGGLTAVGIPSTLRFEPIGGTGHGLVDLIDKNDNKAIGGEAVLRIDNRCVV
jgi:mediator of RNA polymerase II transcription subunit 17